MVNLAFSALAVFAQGLLIHEHMAHAYGVELSVAFDELRSLLRDDERVRVPSAVRNALRDREALIC